MAISFTNCHIGKMSYTFGLFSKLGNVFLVLADLPPYQDSKRASPKKSKYYDK